MTTPTESTESTESTDPAGWREDRDGTPYVVYRRTFRAPIESVWAAVTEPERLQRWIGTWTGDPASGRVSFVMTAEGQTEDDAEAFTIHACEAPRLLELSSAMALEDGAEPTRFVLRLELSYDAGVTSLVFAQSVATPELGESMGPGWEYYLDRLVAAEAGGEVAAIDFDDYYPAHAPHYRALFG